MTAFAKGHGTENDFVLLPDGDGRLDLTPDLVRGLCDRRAGIRHFVQALDWWSPSVGAALSRDGCGAHQVWRRYGQRFG